MRMPFTSVQHTNTQPLRSHPACPYLIRSAASAKVLAAPAPIAAAPVEARCGAPSRLVVYYSNRRLDPTPGCSSAGSSTTATAGSSSSSSSSAAAATADQQQQQVLQRLAGSGASHVIFSRLRPNADGLNVTLAAPRDRPVLANLARWVARWQSTQRSLK